MKAAHSLCLVAALALVSCTDANLPRRTEVLVVGGGASGTAAGVQAARLGAKTVIAEETLWLGGMLTSAGVSCEDGNFFMRSGIFGEFVDSLAARYGSLGALQTNWVSYVSFEPHVGAEVFSNMAAAEKNLKVYFGERFVSAQKLRKGWRVTFENAEGKRSSISARILIDGTELGDVAKACGVGYDIGMEARSVTGEAIAPEEGNDVIQDLTYCMTLKDYGPDSDMTIPEPKGYRPEIYRNCCISPLNREIEPDGNGGWRKADTKQKVSTPASMLSYGKLPVKRGGAAKYMINWPCDGNDVYVNIIEASPERRREALDSAKNVTLGFLYFLQSELGYRNLGLADDEYPTEDLLPMIPYHRESRRIHGLVRFTMDNAARPFDAPTPLYRTGIASGDYPVDHHHFRNEGWAQLPYLEFYPIASYNVPVGVLLPEAVDDLLVAEKSVSVSNLVNGTTRLQPMTLQFGQAAGAIAALSVRNGSLDKLNIRQLQDILIDAGVYVMPYRDLTPDDPRFGAEMRIGATGILRGTGKPKGWANETWFRGNDPLLWSELFLEDYYPDVRIPSDPAPVSVDAAVSLIQTLSGKTVPMSGEQPITRIEFAVMLDTHCDPFHSFDVDFSGNIIR